MKPEELAKQPVYTVELGDLKYGQQLIMNGYIVERTDVSLRPLQTLETDAQGRQSGEWDSRMHRRFSLCDERTSKRIHIYPDIAVGVSLDAGGRFIETFTPHARYEVRDFFGPDHQVPDHAVRLK